MEWFERLKSALLITSIKGDIRQPHNEAMGHVAKGYSRWQTASSYFYDIERVLLEMKMARSFVDALPDDTFLQAHGTNAEDYILYHNGFYLDLVHQLKDKMAQMVNAIVKPDTNYSSRTEGKLKLSKVLNNERTKRIPGLVDAMTEWDDSAHDGPIAVALKKRTNYHHHKNPLTGTQSYFQARAQRNLLKPEMLMHLSDYGKQMIDEKRKKSLDSWQTEAKEKMQKTSDAIQINLEAISKSVVEYYKFPKADEKEAKQMLLRYMPLLESVKTVPSTRTIADIDTRSAEMLQGLAALLEEALGKDLVAFYITGSMARGEFNFGMSDVNMVIILADDTATSKDDLKDLIEAPAKIWPVPLDTKIFLKGEFLAKENERIRFICKTDGTRLSGDNLLMYEPLHNKSFKLVWLLNSDFRDKLNEYRTWVEGQATITPSRQTALIARDIAKRAYRMAFGQVIGNNTAYTASFKEMRRLLNFYTPENKRSMDLTYRLTQSYPWLDKEGFLAMLDSYERNLGPFFDRVNEVVNGPNEELVEGENPAIPTVEVKDE